MLGLTRGKLLLCPHCPEWKTEAGRTIQTLKRILGNVALDVQHIGSTSIPNIVAKPIVDVAVKVNDFQGVLDLEEALRVHGFHLRECAESQLLFGCGSFYEGNGDLQTHFIHVVKDSAHEWSDYIRFRDFLRERSDYAKLYEDCKTRLFRTLDLTAFDVREKYVEKKGEMIRYILRKEQVYSFIGKLVDIEMDRPIGAEHPKHKGLIYPINYGFLPGVIGGDGEELDVYLLGVDIPVSSYRARVIGIAHRADDEEDKLIAAPDGFPFDLQSVTDAVHFQEQFHKTEIELLK